MTESARHWFSGLTSRQQVDVRASVGVHPDWMGNNSPVDEAGLWFGRQTFAHQIEVRSMIGDLPAWMVASLARAMLPAIAMRDATGWQGHMMPAALLEFLDRP
ncbi:MAG: hypothetical protein JWM34_1778 [Ilumatobacteraceae bacterium]|nr:hypothetical protein [Ilumatobacteraceae bacterium]